MIPSYAPCNRSVAKVANLVAPARARAQSPSSPIRARRTAFHLASLHRPRAVHRLTHLATCETTAHGRPRNLLVSTTGRQSAVDERVRAGASIRAPRVGADVKSTPVPVTSLPRAIEILGTYTRARSRTSDLKMTKFAPRRPPANRPRTDIPASTPQSSRAPAASPAAIPPTPRSTSLDDRPRASDTPKRHKTVAHRSPPPPSPPRRASPRPSSTSVQTSRFAPLGSSLAPPPSKSPQPRSRIDTRASSSAKRPRSIRRRASRRRRRPARRRTSPVRARRTPRTPARTPPTRALRTSLALASLASLASRSTTHSNASTPTKSRFVSTRPRRDAQDVARADARVATRTSARRARARRIARRHRATRARGEARSDDDRDRDAIAALARRRRRPTPSPRAVERSTRAPDALALATPRDGVGAPTRRDGAASRDRRLMPRANERDDDDARSARAARDGATATRDDATRAELFGRARTLRQGVRQARRVRGRRAGARERDARAREELDADREGERRRATWREGRGALDDERGLTMAREGSRANDRRRYDR